MTSRRVRRVKPRPLTVDASARPGYACPVAGGAPAPTPTHGDLLDQIDAGIAKAEGAVLVGIIATMILVSTLQLILRKLIDIELPIEAVNLALREFAIWVGEWADILVRQMVLWIGFVGGALATHQSRHIAIDAVNKLLAPRKAAIIRAVTSLIAAGIVAIMVGAAYDYVKGEMESESTIFGDVPAWALEAVVPVVLCIITFHFLVGARNQVLVALGKRQSPEELAEHTGEHPVVEAD